MSFLQRNSKVFALALVAAVATGGLFIHARVSAQDAVSVTTQPAKKLIVGTYDPAAAFQAYPGSQELQKKAQQARGEAMEAQQAGDQQKMQEVSQRFQQDRQRIIGQFESDVEKVMPEVAEQQDVQVVALDVVYTAPGVKTKDVTDALSEQLKDVTTQPAEQDEQGGTALPWMQNTQ